MKQNSLVTQSMRLFFGLAFLWWAMSLAHAQQSWDGPYAGFTAASSRSVINGTTVKTDGTVGTNATNEAANALRDEANSGALVLGFRRQLDSGMIVGLEADLTRAGLQASTQSRVSSGVYAGQPNATILYETPWLATSRAFAAWSFGDLLVFGSAGAAFATEKVTRTQYRAVSGTSETAAQFSEVDRVNRLGYALGTGLEWRWSKLLSIRGEYLHVRFPDEEFRFPDARGGAQSSYSDVQGRIASNGAKLNTFRVGLIYTFGSSP